MVAVMTNMNVQCEIMDIWRDFLDQPKTAFRLIFIMSRKSELDRAAYTFIRKMSGPLIASASVLEASRRLDDYPWRQD